jgi:hypothetical protein
MSPDFEYFFKMSVSSEHSHSKAGIFYFDLPVTIGLALLFHLVVKHNLLANLPIFIQRRFQDTWHFNFLNYLKKNWGIFLISAIVGASSHIFWDSFTHNNRFFVRQFPTIYKSISVPFQGANYPLFYVLQQVSTVVGGAIVVIYILARKPQQTQHLFNPKITYWIFVVALATLILRGRFFLSPSDYDLGNVVVTSISGLLIALVCCGFINFKNSIHYQSLNG